MRHGAFAFLPRNKCLSLLNPRHAAAAVRSVHLPPRAASVTGTVYQAEDPDAPTVTLFTKEGCTLCDKVKDVLETVRSSNDHSLTQIDISDDAHSEWFHKYKYDIPVLHLNSKYWIKHRLTAEQAQEGFVAIKEGTFESPRGEPNASEMERK